MRFILLSAVFLFAAVAVWSQNHSIRQKFKSKDYTVTWGIAPNYPSDAKLVIGYGSGHGGSLGWLRFHPGSGGVEVLSIELDEGWRPYKSKWAPDVAPVTVKRGRMSQKSYTVLLRNIAIVSSVRLKPVTRNSARWSSADFWVATSVSHHNKSLLDLNWAGYASSMDEIDYAQPESAVSLVRKAVAKVPLKEDSLTTDDRRWASAKFVQDWNALGGRKSYWWVAERLLLMVGVVGDETAVPTLVEVIQRKVTGESSDRMIYYAINAATRLIGIDVRPVPAEEMDLESTRQKVLKMLANLET